MKRLMFVMFLIFLAVYSGAYRPALLGTEISRYESEREDIVFTGDIDDNMYINIEANLNNVVYLNISGIDQENLTLPIRAGRHWVITGAYI